MTQRNLRDSRKDNKVYQPTRILLQKVAMISQRVQIHKRKRRHRIYNQSRLKLNSGSQWQPQIFVNCLILIRILIIIIVHHTEHSLFCRKEPFLIVLEANSTKKSQQKISLEVCNALWNSKSLILITLTRFS